MISSYIHFFANSPISFFFRAAKNSHFSLSICLLLDLQAHSITWQMQMWNFSWGCLFSLLWVWTQTWSLKPNSGSLFSFLLRPPFWLPQRWNRLHCPWQCVRSTSSLAFAVICFLNDGCSYWGETGSQCCFLWWRKVEVCCMFADYLYFLTGELVVHLTSSFIDWIVWILDIKFLVMYVFCQMCS